MNSCLFCENQYSPTHGNQRYCSSECKKSQKAASQQKLYGIIKEFRKGFLTNYKLFEDILPKSGKKTLPLTDLTSNGFKVNCYYKAYTDNGNHRWYMVGNFAFSIEKKNQEVLVTILNK
jgi:hypothetical protein